METHKQKYDEYQRNLKEHIKEIERAIEKDLDIRVKFTKPHGLT